MFIKRKSFTVSALMALITCLLFLSACTPTGGEEADITTLIYANLTKEGVDRAAVDRFNAANAGKVRIEVRNYFDAEGRDGKQRLIAEIAAGNGPDILDMRGMPYQALAQKGYLEDLWPLIERDPDLGRAGIVEEPLRAAEVNGGLYVAFGEVFINTLVGPESLVGNRYSWTLEELLEAYTTMPEDSTILSYCTTKEDMFYYVFRMRLENYIDWETGVCGFDCEDFRSSLEFVNSFPTEFEWMDTEEINSEIAEQILTGHQMLSQFSWGRLIELQFLDAIYGLGGRAVCIGYPVDDGSTGSSFYLPYAARKLAISSVCKNKEAAWAFIRQILLPQYTDTPDDFLQKNGPMTLPINRKDYERMIHFDMSQQNAKQMSRMYNGETVDFRAATEEELDRYEDFIHHIDKIEFFDDKVYQIVHESAGAYFAGDKTLDETVNMIQNRVSLYVNERQ